jgi:hypothetical protein
MTAYGAQLPVFSLTRARARVRLKNSLRPEPQQELRRKQRDMMA